MGRNRPYLANGQSVLDVSPYPFADLILGPIYLKLKPSDDRVLILNYEPLLCDLLLEHIDLRLHLLLPLVHVGNVQKFLV